MPAKRGRPPNAEKSIDVNITAQPKLVLYLDDLIAEQGFGASRGEVAKTLVWEQIRSLIRDGVLDRRGATPEERKRVTQRMTSAAPRTGRG